MKRYLLIIFLSVFCGGVVSAQSTSCAESWKKAENREPLTEAECVAVADSIHKRYVTLDSHNDAALYLNHPERLARKVRNNAAGYTVVSGQVSFEKMKEGGLDAGFFAIYLGQKALDQKSLDSVYTLCSTELDLFKKYVGDHAEEAEIAYCPSDLAKIKAKGKSIVVLAIENGYPIGKELSRLDEFYNRGVRYLTLSHNSANCICDASMDKEPERYGGLSDFGYKVIKRMNRLGMIIDVSHASSSTLADVLECSKAPVVATHSGAWEMKNHKRNLTDDEMRAIAAKGGVIQCATGRFFLSHLPKKDVTVKHLVDHIDHMKKIVGPDHIGLGTDFDGGGGVVGLEDCSKMKAITVEMLKRGYTPEELGKFWGGNFLRVWEEIINVSKKM